MACAADRMALNLLEVLFPAFNFLVNGVAFKVKGCPNYLDFDRAPFVKLYQREELVRRQKDIPCCSQILLFLLLGRYSQRQDQDE